MSVFEYNGANGHEIKASAMPMTNGLHEEEAPRHTEEMQEIIGAPPAWLLRWGITLFFSVLILILGLSELIQYPDVVKTQLKIQSTNLPQAVMAGTSGKLVKLWVQNNQDVKQGQTLAIIENTEGQIRLTSPQNGKLTYAEILHENQPVFAKQVMFHVNETSKDFFGELIIPQGSMSKIKEGQQVMIKLSSYPYEEYGMLHGTIKYITDGTFKDGGYLAEVDFKTQNITDMHKPLELKPGMQAEADIITKNSSLFKRLAGNIIKNINH